MKWAFELPVSQRDMVPKELDSDEQVLWWAQPKPSRFARQALPAFLFAIPWTAFAVFWMCGAAGFEVPDFSEGRHFFALFGLPFVLVGLAMLSSPLWMMRKARRTLYVVTQRRAILFEGGWGTIVRSFGPEKLTDMVRHEKRDGSGDLIFEQKVAGESERAGRTTEVGFLGINGVRDIEKVLRIIAEQGSIDVAAFKEVARAAGFQAPEEGAGAIFEERDRPGSRYLP